MFNKTQDRPGMAAPSLQPDCERSISDTLSAQRELIHHITNQIDTIEGRLFGYRPTPCTDELAKTPTEPPIQDQVLAIWGKLQHLNNQLNSFISRI